jgi:hypothetical protein
MKQHLVLYFYGAMLLISLRPFSQAFVSGGVEDSTEFSVTVEADVACKQYNNVMGFAVVTLTLKFKNKLCVRLH